MKNVTCAIVIVNKDGDILGCHGTNKPIANGYDFPKGCRDASDENDLETALRELREEAGHVLTDEEKSKVIDGGIHSHNAKKNIHLFIHKVDKFPDLTKLKCTSYFTNERGREIPEIDGYKIIKKDEREKYFYNVLQNKFCIIDQILNDDIEKFD